MTENAPGQPTLRDRVSDALEAIRPHLQNDGGDVELVDVDDNGVVQVRFHGACRGCPAASITLSQGVQRSIQEKVPEVTQVVLV